MAIEINTETIPDAAVTRLTDCGVLIPRLLTLDQADRPRIWALQKLRRRERLPGDPILLANSDLLTLADSVSNFNHLCGQEVRLARALTSPKSQVDSVFYLTVVGVG